MGISRLFQRVTTKGFITNARLRHFDATTNDGKNLLAKFNTVVTSDGAFNFRRGCVDAGTGVTVEGRDGFRDFRRGRWGNVGKRFKQDDCCTVSEVLSVVDGSEYAVKLLRLGLIKEPLVFVNDCSSVVSNLEKLYNGLGEPEFKSLYERVLKSLELLQEEWEVRWVSTKEDSAAHYLAKSVVKVLQSATEMEDFYKRFDLRFPLGIISSDFVNMLIDVSSASRKACQRGIQISHGDFRKCLDYLEKTGLVFQNQVRQPNEKVGVWCDEISRDAVRVVLSVGDGDLPGNGNLDLFANTLAKICFEHPEIVFISAMKWADEMCFGAKEGSLISTDPYDLSLLEHVYEGNVLVKDKLSQFGMEVLKVVRGYMGDDIINSD